MLQNNNGAKLILFLGKVSRHNFFNVYLKTATCTWETNIYNYILNKRVIALILVNVIPCSSTDV